MITCYYSVENGLISRLVTHNAELYDILQYKSDRTLSGPTLSITNVEGGESNNKWGLQKGLVLLLYFGEGSFGCSVVLFVVNE